MKKKLEIAVGQYSCAGKKAVNQDFHGISVPAEPQLSSKGIAIAIADGISSSNVSQIASETAVTGFLQDYYCTSDSWSVKTSARRVLKAVNSWLYAQTKNSAYRFNKDKGYICTFSAVIFKSNTAHLFHSGDTRVYRVIDKDLELLTNDHRNVVSPEESYLTRALGINETLDMDYRSVSVNEGDVFVLCSDGVYEFVAEKDIATRIATASDEELNAVAKGLVDSALAQGSDDNLTVQIARITTLPDHSLGELQEQANSLPLPRQLRSRMEFDGFEILRDIYISCRSHVFLAQDKESGDKVVIKTPSAEMRDNQAYLENMLMEDWIAKRINNQHVLKAYRPERKLNYLYTVTEYVEGKTLAQWMRDNPQPDVESVRNIVEQVAKGLQAFHRQEMVHQDLRPNNIMIDSSGTVKIIDFGSTKVAGISEISKRNEGIVGTAQFTAPEYFLGQSGTSRSDLFSLGVIAYQMLSGELPYGTAISKSNTERLQRRLNYRPLHSEANTIPGWVDYAVAKATQISPLKRYEEVSEFIYELRYPNKNYLEKTRPPLLERNPVLFWQCVSMLLLGVVIYQAL